MKKLQHLLPGLQHRELTQGELRNLIGGQGASSDCLAEGSWCKTNPEPEESAFCCDDLLCVYAPGPDKFVCVKPEQQG